MNKELTKKLYNDFPKLYKQNTLTPEESAMYWGFPDDGWEPLIRNISEKIENYNNSVPEDLMVEATQVKEKFGSLRFYTNKKCTDEIEKVISATESNSAFVCEICGSNIKKIHDNCCPKCYES